MTEIVEYCLVFMVSTLFVAGSVATYDSFSSFSAALQFRLASGSISRLAAEATTNGSSSGVIDVPPSTIRCEGGVMSFTSGNSVAQQVIPAACSFAMSVSGGAHAFGFRFDGTELNATVT